MDRIILIIEIILIRQLGYLVERVSDKKLMERIDYFQKKTGVSDAIAGELYQGLATSFPEMSTMFISVVFFALNPVVGIASNVGSGVFQFMPVIAIPALVAVKALVVDKYEVIRTVSFYISTLLFLGLCILDGNLHRAELVGMVVYWAGFMYWSIRYWPTFRKRWGEPEAPVHDHHINDEDERSDSLFQKIGKFLPEMITKTIP